MIKIGVLSAFLLLFVAPSVALAQGHSVYCKDIDSTAASQKCLTKHLRSAQARLNEIYVKLGEALEEEGLAQLKELQKIWLTYRDAECMWEAQRSEEVSLKRVNELSCMARVTEDRADLLTIAYGDVMHPETQRQFGAFPSWMNAVAKQYPAIYWNYGARMKGDINCDGQDEHIMTGLQMGASSSDVHLVVVENPAVGKPNPTLFTFPVKAASDEGTKNSICSHDINLEIQEGVMVETKEGTDKACHQSLLLMSKQCSSKTIKWTGKVFGVAVEEEPIDNKKIKKN